ncbi:MAG TPA: ECF-type sigma factor, partial [Gemmataceae bacterium]
MPTDDPVTVWLGQLLAGDPAAVRPLWEQYFHRLVGLARKRLREAPRRGADEEDVALSAFDSFCRNAEQGRFPDLTDRESLWRLLSTFTLRKAAHQVRDA